MQFHSRKNSIHFRNPWRSTYKRLIYSISSIMRSGSLFSISIKMKYENCTQFLWFRHQIMPLICSCHPAAQRLQTAYSSCQIETIRAAGNYSQKMCYLPCPFSIFVPSSNAVKVPQLYIHMYFTIDHSPSCQFFKSNGEQKISLDCFRKLFLELTGGVIEMLKIPYFLSIHFL